MSVDTNSNAELSMRVKALEADVAELQSKITTLIVAMGSMSNQLDGLRRRTDGR